MKVFISIILVLLFWGFTQSIYSQNSSDIVLHLNCDGNVSDDGPNSYQVTNANASFTTDRFGNVESALQLNGTSSMLEVAYFNRPHVFSLSTWVKITDGADGMILSWCGTLGETFEIAIWGGKLDLGEYDGTNWTEANIDAEIANDEWHHVGVAINNSTASFYLDGVQQSFTYSSDPGEGWGYSSNYDKLTIGGYYWGDESSRFFNGDMDDLRLYNGALTETDFANIFNETVGIKNTQEGAEKYIIEWNNSNNLVINNLSNRQGVSSVFIFDVAGKLIFNDSFTSNSYCKNMSFLNKGVYVVKIGDHINQIARKISVN